MMIFLTWALVLIYTSTAPTTPPFATVTRQTSQKVCKAKLPSATVPPPQGVSEAYCVQIN